MAKFYGKVGYAQTTETSPGIWTEGITEKYYYGDVLRNTRRFATEDKINGAITTSDTISVVADAFAFENFLNIRYVEYMGQKCVVQTVEVERPRLKLYLGGKYNG